MNATETPETKPDVKDDTALFEVVGFLMDKLGNTQDTRVAEIAEFAIQICQRDPQVVAKLLAQVAVLQKANDQANQNPFNPFQPPVQRTNGR